MKRASDTVLRALKSKRQNNTAGSLEHAGSLFSGKGDNNLVRIDQSQQLTAGQADDHSTNSSSGASQGGNAQVGSVKIADYKNCMHQPFLTHSMAVAADGHAATLLPTSRPPASCQPLTALLLTATHCQQLSRSHNMALLLLSAPTNQPARGCQGCLWVVTPGCSAQHLWRSGEAC